MTEEIKLADKAINIQGKKYVLVSDRVVEFNKLYTSGMIQTKLLTEPDADMLVMMAKVTPNVEVPERYFTGFSQATWGDGLVNKTAALENCETSAVGRALAMMGIGVIDSIASVDEINKAQSQPAKQPKNGSESELWCEVHKCKMYLNKNGKPYHRNGDEFCNGGGYPSEREDWRNKQKPVYKKPVEEDETPTKRGMTDAEVEDINSEIPF